jgi:hypothetical protein
LNFIAWVLGLGVGAPTGPPEFSAYNLLRGRDNGGQQVGLPQGCELLLDGLQPDGTLALADEATRLYRGAAHACLGAFSGGESHWSAAQKALAALAPPLSCMDIAAYWLLKRLVTLHQANPTGGFVFGTTKTQGKRPPCPRMAGMSPTSGPRSGSQVVITGENLERILSVVVYLQDTSGDFGPEEVLFQPGSEAISLDVADPTGVAIWACVVVQGAPGWNGDGERFTFVDPQPTIVESATPAPSPAPPCPPPSE